MMSEYPACTEMPDDVWKTSEWYPQVLVSCRLRKLVKEGKQLPTDTVVNSVVAEMSRMIKENGGLSARKPLDFEPALKGLETE